MRNALVVAIVLAGLSAFGGELKVNIGPSSPYVLPIGLTSCRDQYLGIYPPPVSMSPNSLEWTRFKFQWTGEQTSFRFSALQFKFQAPELAGGRYECTLAGDELDAVLRGQRVLPPNDPTEYSGRCTLRCGGITIVSGTSSALIPGTLKVFGVEEDRVGNASPVTTEVPISMIYQKF